MLVYWQVITLFIHLLLLASNNFLHVQKWGNDIIYKFLFFPWHHFLFMNFSSFKVYHVYMVYCELKLHIQLSHSHTFLLPEFHHHLKVALKFILKYWKKKSLWAIYEQYIPWVIANLKCLPVSFILDIIELHVMSLVTFEELHCSTVIHHWRAQGHFQPNENYLYDTVCEQMSYFTVTSLRQLNMLLLLQSLSSTLPPWQDVLWKYCSYVGLEIKPNPRKLPLPFQGPTSHFCKNRCVGLHLCFCLLF